MGLYSHICIMVRFRCQLTKMKSPETTLTTFLSHRRALNRVSDPSYHPAAYCQGGRYPAPPACIVRTPSSRHRSYNIFRPRSSQSCLPFRVLVAGKHYTICRPFSLPPILLYKNHFEMASIFSLRPTPICTKSGPYACLNIWIARSPVQ